MYWIYYDRVHRTARVHLDECTLCDCGRGLEAGALPLAGDWLGPFTTEADAVIAAAAICEHTGECVACLSHRWVEFAEHRQRSASTPVDGPGVDADLWATGLHR